MLKILTDKIIAFTIAEEATLAMEREALSRFLRNDPDWATQNDVARVLLPKINYLVSSYGIRQLGLEPLLAPNGRLDLLAGLRPNAPRRTVTDEALEDFVNTLREG